MPAKIPATIVTGFLGAGKTTLIRHMLENAGGRRIALIINEFGDLGVDGAILEGCGIEGCDPADMVELSNGCICCAVADDFIPAMAKLIERAEPPDHIVIETSGLALPQPLVRAFNWPDVRTRVTVDGVVAVVDGKALAEGRFAWDEAAVLEQRAADPALEHDVPLAELFEDQVACADLLLVNKADLLGEDEAGRLMADLASKARGGVRLLSTRHGRLPVEVLLGLGVGAENDVAARAEIHHPHAEGEEAHEHDDFESFVVVLPEQPDIDALEARVAAAIAQNDLLRVKGFAAVAGKPMRVVVQAVGPRVATHFDRQFRPDETRATRLVVIGETGIDRAAVAEALGASPVAA
jgi:cobalamin biosynthesis protein CobW